MNEKIEKALLSLPHLPGVYIMKNSEDRIIYVGKAISLKNRVSQYFHPSSNHSLKVKAMVSNIDKFDYIITDTESEALILENTLIKKYQPQYNILLKDDKTYPYIKITREDFPRVIKTRRIINDGGEYFGPYTDVYGLNYLIESLHELFKLRTCRRDIQKSIEQNKRPCLNYYIKKCTAPCNGKINREQYNEYIEEVRDILQGKNKELKNKLVTEMKKASSSLRYEEAALIRDRIRGIENLKQTQNIMDVKHRDNFDVLSCYFDNEQLFIHIFYVRAGKIFDRDYFDFKNVEDSAEVFASFIKQFYLAKENIPEEIIVQYNFNDMEILAKTLSLISHHKVTIREAKRGRKKQLLDLGRKNAGQMFVKANIQVKKPKVDMKTVLSELARIFALQKNPHRIELYDISHFAGMDSVGSQVVYVDGIKSKKDYRRYRIKSVNGNDDYLSLTEIITRRVNKGDLPDLFLLDGGKGQVSVIKKLLEKLEIDVPVRGLYKDDKHRTQGICTENEEIALDKKSDLFKLLYSMQEEVHRFAITFHKTLRQKHITESELDKIKGIGEKRKRILLNEYGSVDKISQLSYDELVKTSGIDKKTAKNIVEYFAKKADKPHTP